MSAWPWPSSESTGEVIPAFVAALQSAEDVIRNKKADIETKTGSKVRYNYADLDAVLEQIKPVLFKHGLAVTQAASNAGVQTVLMHTSAEWLSFPALEVKTGQATPQAHGSALTYARRYSILAALNIATEDDDGKAAGAPAPKPVKTAATREAEKIRAELGKLPADGRSAFKAWRGDRGVDVDDLAGDGDWRDEVQNWLDAWAHDHRDAAA